MREEGKVWNEGIKETVQRDKVERGRGRGDEVPFIMRGRM